VLGVEWIPPSRHRQVQAGPSDRLKEFVEAEQRRHERDGVPEELLLLDESSALVGGEQQSAPGAEHPVDLGEGQEGG